MDSSDPIGVVEYGAEKKTDAHSHDAEITLGLAGDSDAVGGRTCKASPPKAPLVRPSAAPCGCLFSLRLAGSEW